MEATAARNDKQGLNVRDAAGEAPTQQFLGAAVGDRCASCGSALATDQLYCLNCGERRGKPRFALGTASTPAAAAPDRARRPPRRQRLSSSTALVAGVGTLLLAMGVGVLIGHTDTASNQRASTPPPQVISVGGAPSAAPAAPTTAAKTKAVKAKGSKRAKAAAAQAKANQISPKQAAKAQAAASKVLGSSKNLPPPTVTQGQAGHGPGYSNGHFTGTFFGQ